MLILNPGTIRRQQVRDLGDEGDDKRDPAPLPAERRRRPYGGAAQVPADSAGLGWPLGEGEDASRRPMMMAPVTATMQRMRMTMIE